MCRSSLTPVSDSKKAVQWYPIQLLWPGQSERTNIPIPSFYTRHQIYCVAKTDCMHIRINNCNYMHPYNNSVVLKVLLILLLDGEIFGTLPWLYLKTRAIALRENSNVFEILKSLFIIHRSKCCFLVILSDH